MPPVRAPVRQPVAVPAAPERFPFDVEFQKSLVKLICLDGSFARAVMKYLQPHYFENEVLAWAYALIARHTEQYGAVPSLHLLLQQTRALDPRVKPVYQATIEQVIGAALTDEQWLRDAVLEFVKRNVFVRAFTGSRDLYNSGSVTQAYDSMMEAMETIRRTTWEPVDRANFFDELPQREAKRVQVNYTSNAIPTGIGWLDTILSGGLSLGELGFWLAYPKVGKSSMLIAHGVACTRLSFRPAIHFVLEGHRAQVENKYDTAFSGQLYSEVKDGGIRDAAVYQRLFKEYQYLKNLLVIRGFTDRWDFTVSDIDDELTELKRASGWKPQMILLDYIDLLSGRGKGYKSETEKQRAACRDVKTLANRGYAVWTATQAQRPKEGRDNTPENLYARQVADCYDKVRVADFFGSLNATSLEKEQAMLRVFAELYRDNAANRYTLIRADFSRMLIREEAGLVSPTPFTPGTETRPEFLYTQMTAPW